jgi:hypothetical protein
VAAFFLRYTVTFVWYRTKPKFDGYLPTADW